MTTTGVLQSALCEGPNDASVVTRVLVLDWYDGPVAGVLQIGDAGPVFRFQLLDDCQKAADDESRAYGLYPLPPGALSRLTEAIRPYLTPRWPVWVPVWRFPSEPIREAVEAQIEETMKATGPLTWVVGERSAVAPFGPCRFPPARLPERATNLLVLSMGARRVPATTKSAAWLVARRKMPRIRPCRRALTRPLAGETPAVQLDTAPSCRFRRGRAVFAPTPRPPRRAVDQE